MTGGRLRAVVLALAGGALVGVSLPPVSLWPLGVLGAAAVFLALTGRRLGERLVVGFAFGVGQFFVGLVWALQFNAAGYVALCIVEAAFFAVAAGLVAPSGGQLASSAGAFCLAEWARQSWPFGGLPLGGISLGQVGGPLVWSARLGGTLLVAGVTFLAGAVLADVAVLALGLHPESPSLSRRRPLRAASPRLVQQAPRRGVVAPLLGAVLVIALAIFGAKAPNGNSARPKLLTVAIVQGGGVRGLSQLEVPADDVLRAAVRETARLRGHVEMILWPEDVVAAPGRFLGSADARLLASIAASRRATLVAGVTEPVGTKRFRNEIVAFGPDGRLDAVFEKVHRVPFGEYVPWRGLFRHLADLNDVPRDAIAGHGSGLMRTPAGRFAVLVSYEVFFADRGRSGVRAGGRVILVPTNTSSYSSDQAPSQEVAASRLQAVEEGRYLLQAAPTGYSAAIDNDGGVLAKTGLSAPAILEVSVPELSGETFFERLGSLPVLLAAALSVLCGWVVAVAGIRPERRRRAARRRGWGGPRRLRRRRLSPGYPGGRGKRALGRRGRRGRVRV